VPVGFVEQRAGRVSTKAGTEGRGRKESPNGKRERKTKFDKRGVFKISGIKPGEEGEAQKYVDSAIRGRGGEKGARGEILEK